MKRLIPFIFFISIGAFGCSQLVTIQVPTVDSADGVRLGPYLGFENDTIRVAYNFWGEKGLMGIVILNKLKIPIYVDWKKCAFIIGSGKFDYWNETETIRTTTATSHFGAGSFAWFSNSSGSMTTVVTKPERVTFIPPNTAILRGIFTIASTQLPIDPRIQPITIDTTVVVIKDNLLKWNKSFKYQVYSLSQANSPLRFSSFLTYSTDEHFQKEAYVSSAFYVSSITIMPEQMFTRTTWSTPNDMLNSEWNTPCSFYIPQQRNAGR
jgi:hypothetical protein